MGFSVNPIFSRRVDYLMVFYSDPWIFVDRLNTLGFPGIFSHGISKKKGGHATLQKSRFND
jgi:inosine/xanthosine triphosphate pyrophosphatase family protein